ncbi:MAG: hypothetical protein K2Y37_08315 [Pirellulales bacterium]|nr:hypothetical protein [Pirellulales bacterium]
MRRLSSWRIPVYWAALIAVAIQPRSSRADANGARKSEFLAKYRPFQERLEKFYGTLQIEATARQEDFPSAVDATHKLVFRATDGRFRVDRVTDRDGHSDQLVRVATPARSFGLHSTSRQGAYAVEWISAKSSEAIENMRLTNPLISAPYGIFEVTIAQFLEMPDLTITSIDDDSASGELLTTVSYERHSTDDKRMQQYGWLTFYPNRCWAFHKYSIGAKDPTGTRLRAVVDYNGERDGIPLLSKAQYWYESGAERKRSLVQTFDVSRIAPGAVDESEFTLSAFNLPEVGRQKSYFGWYVVIVIAIGIVLVLVSSLLKRRNQLQ